MGGGIHTFNFLFYTLIDIPIYIWLGIPLRRYPECSRLNCAELVSLKSNSKVSLVTTQMKSEVSSAKLYWLTMAGKATTFLLCSHVYRDHYHQNGTEWNSCKRNNDCNKGENSQCFTLVFWPWWILQNLWLRFLSSLQQFAQHLWTSTLSASHRYRRKQSGQKGWVIGRN